MVKIMGWEIRRIRPERSCWCCGKFECELMPTVLHTYRDEDVCHDCWLNPSNFDRLDARYWREHPDLVPPCIHCGKVVPQELLRSAVCIDWYFCAECRSDQEVLRHFDKLRLERSR